MDLVFQPHERTARRPTDQAMSILSLPVQPRRRVLGRVGPDNHRQRRKPAGSGSRRSRPSSMSWVETKTSHGSTRPLFRLPWALRPTAFRYPLWMDDAVSQAARHQSKHVPLARLVVDEEIGKPVYAWLSSDRGGRVAYRDQLRGRHLQRPLVRLVLRAERVVAPRSAGHV